MSTCGLEECSSPCHAPASSGRYCAPLRCYCGGCPAHVPVDRGQPVTLEELEARAAAKQALARARQAAAVPITEAPAEVQELRAQLARSTRESLGAARHRAKRERAARRT